MKIRPYVMVGILFVVLIIGTVLVAMSIGKWNPAGLGETHTEGEEDGIQIEVTGELPELHGYMNFKEYLSENKIPLDCVALKLGIPESEFDKETRAIAEGVGLETYQITEKIKDCFPNKSAENHEEKVIEESKPEMNLPVIDGMTNFLGWLEENNISLDCTASKLGIPLADLNAEARTIAEKLGKTPHDLPELIKDCIGKPPLDQKPSPDSIKSETDTQTKGLDETENNPALERSEKNNAVSVLPFLKGTDNVALYCKTNGIPLDCVAKKLGLLEAELDNIGKDIAAKLGADVHVEIIREAIESCRP